MQKLVVFLLIIFLAVNAYGQNKLRGFKAYVAATFANRNVYKTKANLTIKKVYFLGSPTSDPRNFALVPDVDAANRANTNPIQQVTITTKLVPGKPAVIANPLAVPPIAAVPAVPDRIFTTTVTTDIPSGKTLTEYDSSNAILPLVTPHTIGQTTTTTTYRFPDLVSYKKRYIRYKVVYDATDYQYIKILPGCIFSGTTPQDTSIIVDNGNTSRTPEQLPKNYVFQVAKTALNPNTNYLASSALIGKVISLPIKFRKEWDGKDNVAEAALSIGYAFGWKYKLGNNPYHSSYISTIIAGLGVSQQKHLFIGGQDANGKDTLGAKTDELAVTYLTFGVAYEYEKFSVGIFCGKDKMFGKLKNWVYQDKWWFGIGIGYELFK